MDLFSEEIKIESPKKDYTNLDDISAYIMIVDPSVLYKIPNYKFLKGKVSFNLGINYGLPIYESVKLNFGLEYLNLNFNVDENSYEYKILGLRTNEFSHINIPILLSYYVNFKNFYPKVDYVLKFGLNYSYLNNFEAQQIVENKESLISYNQHELNNIFNRSLVWLTIGLDFRIPTKKDLVLSIEPRFSSTFINSYAVFEEKQLLSKNYYFTLNLGVVYSF